MSIVSDARDRFEVALELSELAEEVMRANLRRRHPAATSEQIEDMLVAWFADRPGAEHGDAAGRPVDLSRFALPQALEAALVEFGPPDEK